LLPPFLLLLLSAAVTAAATAAAADTSVFQKVDQLVDRLYYFIS